MQMHIRHETRYRYERPVKYSVQSLHLHAAPRPEPARALAWKHHGSRPAASSRSMPTAIFRTCLTIEEPAPRNPASSFTVVVEDRRMPMARLDDGPLSPLAYLAPTQLTLPSDDLKAFAQNAVSQVETAASAPKPWPTPSTARYAIDPAPADVQDSAAVAFKSGEGVCQDHAHVFIASGARAVGMPARYVSGYLYTGDAKDAASHAWVDAWLGAEIGWQSIDVTHKRPAGCAPTAGSPWARD